MTRSRTAAVIAAALAGLLLAGCGIHIPSDPDGTLDRVEGGVLRAGVSPNGDFVRVDGDEPAGREVDALNDFARSLDADVEWTVGSEEALVRGLERHARRRRRRPHRRNTLDEQGRNDASLC